MNLKKIFTANSKFVLKNVIIMSATFFILSIFLCILSYFYLKGVVIKEYGENLYDIAHSVSRILDKEKILQYKNTLQMDDDYKKIVGTLDAIKTGMDLQYLYVDSWDENGNRFAIYDATEPGDGIENSAYGRDILGKATVLNDEVTKIMSNSDLTSKYHEDNSSTYGHTLSAYYPIRKDGKNIAFVGADYNINQVYSYLGSLVVKVTTFLEMGIIAISIFLVYFFYKNCSSPLRKISKAVSNFVDPKKNKINSKVINLKIDDQSDICILQDSFNKMMSDTKKYIKNIKEITAEKEQVAAELNIATQIQQSLIPHIFPAFPELKEMDIYATMQPARKVGGDFYDFFLLDNNRLAFIIADVSGKGIAAALFMVITKTLVKNKAVEYNTPAEIIENVNKQLCSDNDLGMFITAFFGILDLRTGTVEYTNAGHINPIIKLGKSDFKELVVNKQFVMAGMPNLKFKTEKFKMNKGDILFLYTDGISESMNKSGKYWGKENLLGSLNSISEENLGLKNISDFVNCEIKKFSRDKNQSDDITMLIIRYNGID